MRSNYAPLALFGSMLALAACGNHPPVQVSGDGASLQAARDALTQGEAGTSLAIARGVLASQPHNVTALAQAGDAEAALGDRLAATANYKQALVFQPQNVQARLGLGKLQIRDDLRAAEGSFRAVIADTPRDPIALNDLGYVLDPRNGTARLRPATRQPCPTIPTASPPA